MIKRIVRFGLTCLEAKGLSVLPGQLVEPDNYIWIYVDGGAHTLGYWDLYDNRRHEPTHGLPKHLRVQLVNAIDSTIESAFEGADELQVVVANSFLHSPCKVDKQLYHYVQPRRPALEQAPLTFRELLELNQSRRRHNKRRKVSLAGLTVSAYDLGKIE